MKKISLSILIGSTLLISSCSTSGIQGQDGLQGPKGDTGQTGPSGADGIQGIPGAVGPTGPTGPTGPEGPRGFSGSPGTRGPSGAAGASESSFVAYPNISTVGSNYLNSIDLNDYTVISTLEEYLAFATFSGDPNEDDADTRFDEVVENYQGKFILTTNINLDWDFLEANHEDLLTEYSIDDSEDLMIGKKANDSFILELDDADDPFPPIQFSGLFDGAGKTISGLTILGNDSNYVESASLFYVPNSVFELEDFDIPLDDLNITVKNLNIVDFELISISEYGVSLSAGLFSYVNANRLILSNITVSISEFSSENEDTEPDVILNSSAGLLGTAYVNNVIVDNVRVINSDIISTGLAGGLIGGLEAINSVSITNSSVYVDNLISSYDNAAGGLIGAVQTRNLLIKNSNNQGLVLSCLEFGEDGFDNCDSNENSTAGGIIGLLLSDGNTTFDNVYNSGVVAGFYASGGLVGIAVSSAMYAFEIIESEGPIGSFESEFKISNSYNSGIIFADAYVGGIIGYIYIGDELFSEELDGAPLEILLLFTQLFKTFITIDSSFVSSEELFSDAGTEVGGFIGGFGSIEDNEPNELYSVFTNIELKINNSFLYTYIEGTYTESNPILGSSIADFLNLKVKPVNVFFNYSEDAQFDDLFGSLPIFEDKYFKKNDFIFKNNWDFTNTWKFDNTLNNGLPTLINNQHFQAITPP
jgi:hypothetical protein